MNDDHGDRESSDVGADEDEGESANRFPSPGATLDAGRIVVDQRVRGRLWTGHTGQRPVVLVHKPIPYDRNRVAVDALFRFDVPGLAPLEFLGYPDRGGAEVALVEARPLGAPISELGPLSTPMVVQCGIGLCDAILAWGERREWLFAGFRPESVYVASSGYTGATPRVALLAGDADETTFGGPAYDAPSDGGSLDLRVDDLGFIAAQILWFALLREHPYKFQGALDETQNIWHDRRRPFSGPAELGQILEAVLVADPTKRLGVLGFRDQLAKLGGKA